MTFPATFTPINTPLPPMLVDMMGVTVESRYLGLFYQSNPTWTDGRNLRQFNFFQVWQPFTKHPAIVYPLAIATRDTLQDEDGLPPGLGSDDSPLPTHLILLDRLEQNMAIAPWKAGHTFLDAQHPVVEPLEETITSAQREEIERAMQSIIAEMQANPTRYGMFERVMPPDAELVMQWSTLVAFLDVMLDPEIKQMVQQFERS